MLLGVETVLRKAEATFHDVEAVLRDTLTWPAAAWIIVLYGLFCNPRNVGLQVWCFSVAGRIIGAYGQVALSALVLLSGHLFDQPMYSFEAFI